MYPYVFKGFFQIPSYTLMIALGALAALGAFFFLCRKNAIGRNTVDGLTALIGICFAGGLIGGIVFDKIAHLGDGPWWKPGGIAFAGGLLGGAVCFFVFYPVIIKKTERDIFRHADIFVPCIVIAHSFGRIGCFLGGCCFGAETGSFLGVTYPESSPAHSYYGYSAGVYPTQLFEALFLLILFLVLFFAVPEYKVSVYFISYGIFRFLLEFLRGDNRGSILPGITPSQLLCVIFIICGITLIFFYKYKPRDHKEVLIQA